ncbi:MAG: hypothetical protein ABS960_09700 [Solibacillus isronensis]
MKKRILAAFGALIFACSLPLTEASAASTKQFQMYHLQNILPKQ